MSTQAGNDNVTAASGDAAIPFRLEALVIPVADPDRAKDFYFGTGVAARRRLRRRRRPPVLQLTPPGSNASIIFGSGVTYAKPGSFDGLLLVVDDIDKARNDLLSRGVEVSEPFHDAGGGLGGGFHVGNEQRASGPDTESRSYATYASFEDSEGNRYALLEITERLPGRVTCGAAGAPRRKAGGSQP